MTKELMTDAQLRRRRAAQSKITHTTSTLGLAGAGLGLTAALASRKGAAGEKTLGAIRRVPGLKKTTPEGLKNKALYTGIASGGIGGVGGFNMASIYRDESRRKQQTQLKKESSMDMGYVGEEGTPLTPAEIEAEIEKAWSPSASNFDSEAKREKRGKAYQGAALVGAGAGGAFAAHQGMHAVHEAKKIKPVHLKALKPTVRRGGKAAIGVAAVAGAAGAHRALKRKEQGSWQPYAKRSAFGVEHDPVSKAINIKPENEGKFTASAKKAGKGIQEHAHAVVASSKSSELQRKRAQFAINAKKWAHH
jgi:hypothetical protein